MGIGWGRAVGGPGIGLEMRYITLAAPLFCLVCLQSTLHGSARAQHHLQRAAFLAACVLWAVYAVKGVGYAQNMRTALAKFAADIETDLPLEALAVRYSEQAAHANPGAFQDLIASLRNARLGPYRHRPEGDPDPSRTIRPMVEIAVRKPLGVVELGPGQTHRQELVLDTAASLDRIDLQLQRGRRSRNARFGWSLTDATSGIALVAGEIDLREAPADHFVSLRFPPLVADAPRPLVLLLEVPRDAAAEALLELPQFARRAEAALHGAVPSAGLGNSAVPGSSSDPGPALCAYLYVERRSPLTPGPPSFR